MWRKKERRFYDGKKSLTKRKTNLLPLAGGSFTGKSFTEQRTDQNGL